MTKLLKKFTFKEFEEKVGKISVFPLVGEDLKNCKEWVKRMVDGYFWDEQTFDYPYTEEDEKELYEELIKVNRVILAEEPRYWEYFPDADDNEEQYAIFYGVDDKVLWVDYLTSQEFQMRHIIRGSKDKEETRRRLERFKELVREGRLCNKLGINPL